MKTNRKLVLAGVLSGIMALVVSAVPVLAATSSATLTLTAGSLSVTPTILHKR